MCKLNRVQKFILTNSIRVSNGGWSTYRFGIVLTGDCIEFERSFHLKFVSDPHLAILTELDSRINFLASAHPENLVLDLVRCVPNEQLSYGQLELELGNGNVRIVKSR
mgnify:CR=1 FL=1